MFATLEPSLINLDSLSVLVNMKVVLGNAL